MNYEEALAYIHNVEWMGKKPGLHRMLWLLDRMGNPHKELKFVHVAGTNGKGSACAMISSVLKEAGYKTGMFTSPYIHVFNERIQINGQMISNEDLVEIVTFVKGFIDEIEEKVEKSRRAFGHGSCFEVWSLKKSYLLEHDIEWQTPSELNPRVLFD